jgi:predicted hydrocarbon binding protein
MTALETILSRVPAGKYAYPNAFGRHFLLALESAYGSTMVSAVLNLAGLSHLIDHFPPDDLKLEFDIAHFAAINAGCDAMGRKFRLNYHAGRVMGESAWRWHDALAKYEGEGFRALTLEAQSKIALPVVTMFLCEHDRSGVTLVADEHADVFSLVVCPCCYGRRSEDAGVTQKTPICQSFCGLLEGMLLRMTGEIFKVTETGCAACGDERCVFEIARTPEPKN